MEEFVKLPSYHMLTKDRPKMVEVEVEPMVGLGGSDSVVDRGDDFLIDNFMSQTDRSEKMLGARIDGDYERYVKMLQGKHERDGRSVGDVDAPFVVDSIDGAEHLRSKKSITSVISFSSSLLCGAWINQQTVSAGSSLNILTWQQLRGKESPSTMIPSVKQYFEEKKSFREKNSWNYMTYMMARCCTCLHSIHSGAGSTIHSYCASVPEEVASVWTMCVLSCPTMNKSIYTIDQSAGGIQKECVTIPTILNSI